MLLLRWAVGVLGSELAQWLLGELCSWCPLLWESVVIELLGLSLGVEVPMAGSGGAKGVAEVSPAGLTSLADQHPGVASPKGLLGGVGMSLQAAVVQWRCSWSTPIVRAGRCQRACAQQLAKDR